MTDLLASIHHMRHLSQCLQIAFWISSFNFHTYFIIEDFTGNQSIVINRLRICLVIIQSQSIMLKMSAYYSSREMANMHFMCDRANRNASAAQRIIARL